MDKGQLLDRLGAAGEDRLVLAKILDRAEQAGNRNIPAATDFLSPVQLAQAGEALRLAGFPETEYAALGATRRRNAGCSSSCRTGWRRRTRRARAPSGVSGPPFGPNTS